MFTASTNFYHLEKKIVWGSATFNREEKESEQIMISLSSEEAMNFKARSIALVSALTIELADGNR